MTCSILIITTVTYINMNVYNVCVAVAGRKCIFFLSHSVITEQLNKLDVSKLTFSNSYLSTISVVSFSLNCESMAVWEIIKLNQLKTE